jgi:hypothetical protein
MRKYIIEIKEEREWKKRRVEKRTGREDETKR